ncbi:hypothetical protein ACHAQH_009580 [Verticillium albo-atrum]
MWYNPRTPPALPPRSPKRPDHTRLPSPPLLPPRPVSYLPYRPAGAEQWDSSPLQWTHGDQRRQSVPVSSDSGGLNASQSLRRKPVGSDALRPSLPPRPYTSSPPVKEPTRPRSYVSPDSMYRSYAPPTPPSPPVATERPPPAPYVRPESAFQGYVPLSPPTVKERPRSVSCVSPESAYASPVSYAPPSPPNEIPVRPVSRVPSPRWSMAPSPPAEAPATMIPRAPSPRWSFAPSELDAAESSSVPPTPSDGDELVNDIDEMLSELEVSSAGWDGSGPSPDDLDHRRPSLKVTHCPDDDEPSPIKVLPLSPPAVPPKLPLAGDDAPETDTTACLAAPMTYAFPATWYQHPDMPAVWVCAGCFGRHLAGTKFDPQFEGRAYDDGRPRGCWFSRERVLDVLLPRAMATGFFQPVVEYLNEAAMGRT